MEEAFKEQVFSLIETINVDVKVKVEAEPRGPRQTLITSHNEPSEFSDTKNSGVSKGSDLNIGRNDPCPCGSGKKYKKCCINKETNETILNENASSIGEMEPLYNRLPELAEKETRTAFVMPGEKLPAGMYSMFESFCNDKKCDCRRVFINVEHNGKILATIGYGWETNKFYKEWLGDDELVKHMKGPVLELTGAHTNMSNDLLEFFEETMLMDITFLNRLESQKSSKTLDITSLMSGVSYSSESNLILLKKGSLRSLIGKILVCSVFREAYA